LQRRGSVSIIDILRTKPTNRSPNDKSHLALHLAFAVKFFTKYKFKLLLDLCSKIFVQDYEVGDVIMKQGEPGDVMHIIFEG
jgi:hypothetical protein